MKKLVLAATATLCLTSSIDAKDTNVVEKILRCNTVLTNGAVIFDAQKSKGGYDVSLRPKSKMYSIIFNKDAKIHIAVDEGPLITTPSFGFGKAGLKASGDVLEFFSKELLKDIDKTLKKHPKFTYEGKVSFGGELNSKSVIDAVTTEDNYTKFNTSKLTITNSMDIDTCIGKIDINIPSIEISDKEGRGSFKAKDVDLISEITDKPIENIVIFSITSLKAKELSFKAKAGGKPIDAKLSLAIDSESKKVDDKYMDFNIKVKSEALNTNTIALAKGIKKSEFDIELKNTQTDGMLELIKLSDELDDIQSELAEASKKNDDVALQKALLKMNELSSVKTVSIYNKTLVKDKTRLKLNFSAEGEKTSFIKLDLLYKANPISGNLQSAMIELAAQNLAIVDGTFEIQLDSEMATAVNPFAMIALDMLKAKGFVTVKNGIYHLKGELKGGKIVINGKAYTLQELSRVMFQK